MKSLLDENPPSPLTGEANRDRVRVMDQLIFRFIKLQGTASIVNDDEVMLVRTNESTYIPAGHKHRLENPGLTDLIIIEVQSGEYLGEDVIVRFDEVSGQA